MDNEYVKRRTLELYDSLPQNKEERMKCLDVRDEVIQLNYSFFGYIAKTKFINNNIVDYEDKLQHVLMHFCRCWWWYKWQGDETHHGYRQDLAFTSFFKLRLGEMIEELNDVKYSLRRSICIKIGDQLGKHWSKVTYDDLSKVTLSVNDMNTAKAIFGTMYTADFEDHEMYLESESKIDSPFEHISEEYNSTVSLLIHDMVVYEEKLTLDKLVEMSEMYGIPFEELHKALPTAEKILYDKLNDRIECIDASNTSI